MPSPEDQAFNLMVKNNEKKWQEDYYIFQKGWIKEVLPEVFKLGPKIMLPKPNKTDYNVTKSYRPITLESVIGKIMERVICNRLIWKLEVDEGKADTQLAYRKQKSCVHTMLRVCNSI